MRRARSRRRSGYVLVLLGMLLFGLFALAALVIDLGFARLTQRQMQTAADSAALEGLRFRDSLPPNPSSANVELERRLHVQRWVIEVFDDDFQSSNADHAFGAGPLVELTGGVGAPELLADQDLNIPETPFFRPVLSTNFDADNPNDNRGDMVSGNFDASVQNPLFDPENPVERRDEFIDEETGDYIRRNFTVPPLSPIDQHNAFVVRLRRTGEILPADVGTSGPPVNYLFGRGSTLPRQFIGDGIRIRGTSVASLEPVICVGNAAGLTSSLGIAVSITDWNDSDSDTFFVYPLGAIGGQVDLNEPTTPTNLPIGYVAIFDSIASNRVIGFGIASVVNGELIRVPSVGGIQIASENASAVPCVELPDFGPDRGLVFQQRTFHRASLAQAPVSAR